MSSIEEKRDSKEKNKSDKEEHDDKAIQIMGKSALSS